MARLYMLFFLLEVLLLVFALISCLSAEKGQVRTLPRTIWAFIIVLLPLAGSLLYFWVGRPEPTQPAPSSWRAGLALPEPVRPKRSLAPDDDPDFLRTLDGAARRNEAELLRQWEEDLKGQDNDPRKREDTPPADG